MQSAFTQPILEIYSSLRPQQKYYIRMVLWDRYREDLMEYLQAEGNATPDHTGHIFAATGTDPDGLLVQALAFASEENITSIQDLCLSILEEQLDKTKRELAELYDDEKSERVVDWEREQLRKMSETMITIFPGLRPIIADFALQEQQQKHHDDFFQRRRKSGREPLH